MNIEKRIRSGDLEVVVYRDARGLLSSVLFYQGEAQVNLTRNMMKLMLMAMEE
jgi:hypothetical protein